MKYHHKTNIQKRKRQLKATHRTLLVVLVVVIFILLLLAWLGLQYMWNEVASKEGPAADKGYYAGSTKTTYDNGKFAFTSAKNWVPEERTSAPPDKFVYVSQRGLNVDYLMTVYLNNIPEIPTKYVLPVKVVGNRMSTEPVSPKCGNEKNVSTSAAPTSATIAASEYKGIKFTCKMEGFENIVALVHDKDGYKIPMATAEGKIVPVGIVIQDLAVNLQMDPIREIVNSFVVK
jgi:hypothetical protein